jgi:hypothetical protein
LAPPQCFADGLGNPDPAKQQQRIFHVMDGCTPPMAPRKFTPRGKEKDPASPQGLQLGNSLNRVEEF